ncbi:MAG: penicillin-binding protein [Bacteroidales bacterium]|nr:penicillin-binding protein [Bacteroidales bacterium]MEE0907131.1 penicillin-binding protein [Muribaculaceae bacterium]
MTKRKNRDYIMGRYIFIMVGIILVAIAVAVRLFSTTVIHAAEWEAKAESLNRTRVVEPERGKILADDRTVLAANVNFYVPRLDLRSEGIKEDTLMRYLKPLCDSLAVISPYRTARQWEEQISDAYTHRYTKRGVRSFPIGNKLTYSQLQRMKKFPFIKLGSSKSGFYYEEQPRRCNPYGRMAARSIGKIAYDTVKRRVAGSSGLERALDDMLYGEPGEASSAQYANSIGLWEHKPAKKGYDVLTTINVALQEIVEQELSAVCKSSEADWGTAVLMEVNTGEIKAISNLKYYPKIDDYMEGENHAVMGYEPGSVMKPISMMMALEDGIVSDLDATIATGHSFAYAHARPITDSHGMASMRIRDVIAYSSNIGMAKIILRRYESQPGMFHHRLREMGFFDPLNIGISGETVPVVDSVGNKNWDRVKLSRMAYGYSTLIPPICTLAMYNAIANGGRYVRPRLVQRFMREGEPDSIVPLTYIRDQVCTPGNARKLAEMLRNVVEYGTGKSLRNDQVAIAGKTGTCYVTEVGRGYSSKKRLSFCGFFPYENPKYSCIVVMEGANCGAARSSGTVLKNVALKLYSLGMLNNISDFHASEQKSTTRPTFFATAADRSNNSKLVANAGIKELKRFRSPRNVTDGEVPEVIGLGAREAISRLEAAGLKVKLHGYGYVARQSVRAGTKAEKGTLVELTLRE